jgi:transposase
MDQAFSFSKFLSRFPDDNICLEEIKRARFPKGIRCENCKKITTHYKILKRTAYACKYCRTQVYPLAGTIFEKTTTPLRLWFYTMFLMTHTRGAMSAKQLQRELGVTYKTAWRMYRSIYELMSQNNGDLLAEFDKKVHRWTFFNKIEITVVEKQGGTE